MICYRFVTVEGCRWRRLWAGYLRENVLGSVIGKTKTGGGVRSNQIKRLGYIKCFNVSLKWQLAGYLLKVATNCAILWNQKLWWGICFLHKNKMKQRIRQACSLKNSIKKGMFSIVSKTYSGYLVWAEGEYSSFPPLSPPWLIFWNLYEDLLRHCFFHARFRNFSSKKPTVEKIQASPNYWDLRRSEVKQLGTSLSSESYLYLLKVA